MLDPLSDLKSVGLLGLRASFLLLRRGGQWSQGHGHHAMNAQEKAQEKQCLAAMTAGVGQSVRPTQWLGRLATPNLAA